ncbi:hypothetical protein CRE_13449 [Caenorhabditis remanei]|uniref:RING-type domain-containing protein n=1 Tax=Caenorhabditis remanei TaxID=31234 RepID=E3MR12_CAERE|nr:hypothetical protein CRE_13449 [Caenorhabditis remanei]
MKRIKPEYCKNVEETMELDVELLHGGTILITCVQLISISCIGQEIEVKTNYFSCRYYCDVGTEIQAIWFICFVCNVSNSVLYFLFILELESLCRLKYKRSQCYFVSFITFCELTVFLISFRFNPRNPIKLGVVIFPIAMPLIIHKYTLWTVFQDRIELLNNEMSNVENRKGRDVSRLVSTNNEKRELSPPEECNRNEVCCSRIDETSPKEVDAQGVSSLSGLECEICMLNYDGTVEKQTPRILIKCGHTVCQECIENILNQYNQQHIFCLFSKQVTVVDGGDVTKLPKNYGILRLMQ